jgi:hypothetical protein
MALVRHCINELEYLWAGKGENQACLHRLTQRRLRHRSHSEDDIEIIQPSLAVSANEGRKKVIISGFFPCAREITSLTLCTRHWLAIQLVGFSNNEERSIAKQRQDSRQSSTESSSLFTCSLQEQQSLPIYSQSLTFRPSSPDPEPH